MAVNAATLDAASLLAALLDDLDPVYISPSANPAVSFQGFSMRGLCTGWSFRDVGGTTGSVQEKGSTTATGTQITAALTDTAGEQTFITGIDITLGVAAAAATVTATVTGLANPLSFDVTAETSGIATYSYRFPQPIPGAAITLTLPAVGGGAAANAINIYGSSSGSTGGLIDVFSGHDAGGVYLATISVPAGGAVVQTFGHGNALPFDNGLFLNVVSGNVRGSVWGRVG